MAGSFDSHGWNTKERRMGTDGTFSGDVTALGIKV
jgi:hypothetical protein